MTCRNCDAPTTREYCSRLCHDMDQHPAPRDDMEMFTVVGIVVVDSEGDIVR